LSLRIRDRTVEYLSPEEAHSALAIEKEIERPWQLWKAAASGK
jgi:hypothetical protein